MMIYDDNNDDDLSMCRAIQRSMGKTMLMMHMQGQSLCQMISKGVCTPTNPPTHVHPYTHTHTCTHTHTSAYTNMPSHTPMYIHSHTPIHPHVHPYTHACIHQQTNPHASCTPTCTSIHTYMHTPSHTPAHTYTCTACFSISHIHTHSILFHLSCVLILFQNSSSKFVSGFLYKIHILFIT